MSVATAVSAQGPRIDLQSAASERFQFRVTEAIGEVARLEGSLNLEDWFALDASAPLNNEANLAFTNDLPGATWFFRAVLDPAVARVTPQVDSNLTSGILITADTGGRMRIVDRQGVTYEFTASSNLVWEPVAIRMTVVTNFSEFPENEGSQASVVFSPENFAFRDAAELKVTFPTNIAAAEMLAYSFDEDGSSFHLLPSTPYSNTVILPITHFSGKGVARFSDAHVPNFDQAWSGAKSAILAAKHRQSLRNRAALREHYIEKTITSEQLDERFRQNDLRSLDDIYQTAVKPFEKAAETDCAVGQAVVMDELHLLTRRWSKLTGQSGRSSPYYPKMVELAPKVRCNCAHRLIERCENEAGVSGSSLLNALDNLLLRSRIYTDRTDAQGCDLGSDEQIRTRLLTGPCFGSWEGSITMTSTQTSKGATNYPYVGTSRTSDYNDEITEVFSAKISQVVSKDIFVNTEGQLEEFFELKLAGPYAVGYRTSEITITHGADMDVINTRTFEDALGAPGQGVCTLLLLDGKFEALGPGGTTSPRVDLPLTFTFETSYRCKTPRPPNDPCPGPYSFKVPSVYRFRVGYSVNATDPALVVSFDGKSLDLTWTQEWVIEQSYAPPTVFTEKIVVNFVRSTR